MTSYPDSDHGSARYCFGVARAGHHAVAFDGTNMWFTDGNSSAIELSSTGAILNTVGVGSTPVGIAFDGKYVGGEQRQQQRDQGAGK